MTWINVKDSLPPLPLDKNDSSEDVVVLNKDGLRYVAVYTQRGRWSEQSTGCGCCAEHIYPTHWMPLPGAPNE